MKLFRLLVLVLLAAMNVYLFEQHVADMRRISAANEAMVRLRQADAELKRANERLGQASDYLRQQHALLMATVQRVCYSRTDQR